MFLVICPKPPLILPMARVYKNTRVASVSRVALRCHGSGARLSLRAMSVFSMTNKCGSCKPDGGTASNIKIMHREKEQPTR